MTTPPPAPPAAEPAADTGLHASHGGGAPAWTPVLTTTGWSVCGALTPGTQLFGTNGHPVTLTHITHLGVQPTARILLADRGSLTVSLNQQWPVRLGSPRREPTVVTTTELMAHLDNTPVWLLIPHPVTSTPLDTTLGRPLSPREANRLGAAYGAGDDRTYTDLLAALGCDTAAAEGWQIPTPVLLGSFATRIEFLRGLPWGQMGANMPSREGLRDLRNLLRAVGAGDGDAPLGRESVTLPDPVADLLANPATDPTLVDWPNHQTHGGVRVAATIPGIPRDLIGLTVDADDTFYVADNLVLASSHPVSEPVAS